MSAKLGMGKYCSVSNLYHIDMRCTSSWMKVLLFSFGKSPLCSYSSVLSNAPIPLRHCCSLIFFFYSSAKRILPYAAKRPLPYTAKRALPYAAVGLGAGTAAVVAGPLVLGAAGFTAGSIAAGSIAASIQSAVYGGSAASGSLFGLAQSAGAAGIGVAGNTAIGGITAGIAGGLTALKNRVFVCFNYKSCSVNLRFWDTFN